MGYASVYGLLRWREEEGPALSSDGGGRSEKLVVERRGEYGECRVRGNGDGEGDLGEGLRTRVRRWIVSKVRL